MSNKNRETRKERFKSKGRSNLMMQLAVGLIALFAVVLFLEFFLGNAGHNKETNPATVNAEQNSPTMITQNDANDAEEEKKKKEEEKEAEKDPAETQEKENSESSQSDKESKAESKKKAKNKDKEKDKAKKVNEKEVTSEDPNVIRAVVGEWEPVGTSQSEPHFTNYDDGSTDRLEIKNAVSQASGVAENDMIENWIGNNGEQKVTATVTQTSTGKVFKVYLSWIEKKGWQATRVEELHQVIR